MIGPGGHLFPSIIANPRALFGVEYMDAFTSQARIGVLDKVGCDPHNLATLSDAELALMRQMHVESVAMVRLAYSMTAGPSAEVREQKLIDARNLPTPELLQRATQALGAMQADRDMTLNEFAALVVTQEVETELLRREVTRRSAFDHVRQS